MGEILKFPGDATRLGYSRVRRRTGRAGDPNQLDLFVPPPARFSTAAPALSPFEEALASDERGETAPAAVLYRKAIESSDCVADAYCNLGILESKDGNTAKAFDCFTTSLRHEPRHLLAHYNLANLYFEVNDFRLAQVHYEIAAEVDPTFSQVYFNLALVQSINQELPTAIATLRKYQQLVPPEEARHAEELMRTLQHSVAAKKDSLLGS